MSPLELASFLTAQSRFAYRGETLDLSLSQSLFSSHEVDRGSRLLLKSLGVLSLPEAPAVLDLGCGTGVLGIAVARAAPGASVWFQDRDALAVSVTAANCRANAVEPACLSADLALEGLGPAAFDLVISNIPAKAGEPVHEHLLRSLASRLRPGGMACLVIVAPLADRISAGLDRAELPWNVAERASSHVVFHAGAPRAPGAGPGTGPKAAPAAEDPLAPYLRARSSMEARGVSYRIDAAYDLPEFDSLSHCSELALEMLDDERASRRLGGGVLVWNPGQGHVPAYLVARGIGRGATSSRPGRGPLTPGPLTLGGRDALALRVSARNCAPAVPTIVHAWDPAEARGPFGCAVIFPDDEPHVGWDAYLPQLLPRILEPRGVAVLSASATLIARLLKRARGLVLLRSRKKAGARCVLLQVA